jgi:hypothetical protein
MHGERSPLRSDDIRKDGEIAVWSKSCKRDKDGVRRICGDEIGERWRKYASNTAILDTLWDNRQEDQEEI